MTSVDPIPTTPVWDVMGRESDGNVRHYERFKTFAEANFRLVELKLDADARLEYSMSEYQSIIRDPTMPTENQRRELCELMHRAFVTLRNLGYSKKHEAVAELADVIHNLPHEMFREEVWGWNLLEAGLRRFEEKYPDDKIFPFAEMLRTIRAKPNNKGCCLC
jgi:hypothetical protein